VHAIIIFDEMQNGAIWGHFRVSTGYLLWDRYIFIEILKWTCTKQWKCSYLPRHEEHIFDNFKIFLSIKIIKIVLDSM
jgi:hypothetical protein